MRSVSSFHISSVFILYIYIIVGVFIEWLTHIFCGLGGLMLSFRDDTLFSTKEYGYFSYFFMKTCYKYLLEVPCPGAFNEYPQHSQRINVFERLHVDISGKLALILNVSTWILHVDWQ